jgi:hypothetical protein
MLLSYKLLNYLKNLPFLGPDLKMIKSILQSLEKLDEVKSFKESVPKVLTADSNSY